MYLVSYKLICVHYCQIRCKLTPILNDAKAPLDVIAFTAISLGFVYVGSCNEEIAQAIIFALMDRSDSELGEPLTRLLPLGLGLLYLGKQVLLISFGFHGIHYPYLYDLRIMLCSFEFLVFYLSPFIIYCGRNHTTWKILELEVLNNSNYFWNPYLV